jgi:uncharacterized protein
MTDPQPYPGGYTDTPSADSRNWATIAHLSSFATFVGVPSPIGPLAVWLLKRNTDAFAAEHAREAINFNLSLWIYAALAVVATVLTVGLGLIAIIPAALVAVPFWFVVTIIAAVKASNGEPYRYPLTLRLVS